MCPAGSCFPSPHHRPPRGDDTQARALGVGQGSSSESQKVRRNGASRDGQLRHLRAGWPVRGSPTRPRAGRPHRSIRPSRCRQAPGWLPQHRASHLHAASPQAVCAPFSGRGNLPREPSAGGPSCPDPGLGSPTPISVKTAGLTNDDSLPLRLENGPPAPPIYGVPGHMDKTGSCSLSEEERGAMFRFVVAAHCFCGFYK